MCACRIPSCPMLRRAHHTRDFHVQASGEAMYTYDMPEERGGLYAAFVGSTEALAVIKGIDAAEALSMPGVVAVLDARDVPGENKSDVEEVFASKKVRLSMCCAPGLDSGMLKQRWSSSVCGSTRTSSSSV